MDVSDPIFAVIGVLALGLIAGGAIVVIDALIIRRIRRLGPPTDDKRTDDTSADTRIDQ